MKTTPITPWAILALIGGLACSPSIHAEEKKALPSPSPTPLIKKASQPSAAPSPAPKKPSVRSATILGYPTPVRQGPTRMFVGQEIPVPKGYSAPRVSTSSRGGIAVQPASPTSFQTIKTGVLIDSREGIEHRELEGFIDYGTPIRTIVPVYNEKGERIGTKVQEYPNPVLQPVIRTIRR